MLMGLGPFRFSVSTYTVDQIERAVSSRVASQAVIGARPRTHLLGPGDETLTFKSRFLPQSLNRSGESLLAAVRAACEVQEPLMLVSAGGRVFGRWIITNVSHSDTMFAPNSRPQIIDVSMTLQRYVGQGIALGGSLF